MRFDILSVHSAVYTVLPEVLGIIHLTTDQTQTNIDVYREQWLNHIGYLAGFNLFVLGILNCILQPILKKSF